MGNKKLTGALESQNRILDLINNNSVTKVLESQNRILDLINNNSVTRALESQNRILDLINNNSVTKVLENQNKIIDLINNNSLAKAFEVQNKVWDQIKGIGWPRILEYTNVDIFDNFNSIIDYAAEEYISENDIDDDSDEKDEISSVADNLLNGNSCVEDLSPKQKVLFLNYVYPIILILVQIIIESIISKPSVVNNNNITNVNNYVTTVNNYYIQEGFSKDFLNDNNLRIVSSEKAIMREKHDCSSKIVGKLPIGKVVCVIGKYKKWVEVSWSDEDGEHYNGWIQNYKLTYFK